MTIQDKIKIINSKRKKSIGFNEEVFHASSIKAIDVINTNKNFAKMNKREKMRRETWIRNVKRVLGFSQEKAEAYYVKMYKS